MITRRLFCGCAAMTAFAASPAMGQDAACQVFTPARQDATTPEEALQRLKDGHARFLAGKGVHCDLLAQAKATASGQSPFAAVVGCIDSRVPPELVFDQRLGDIFVARIAGNFVNTDIVGSLEFATKVAGAKLICVLGHSDCGAVKGAIDDVRLGNLTATLANIRPAVEAAATGVTERSSKNKAFVQAVADTNAKMAVAALTERSEILKELVAARQLRIVAAMHDLATAQVTFV
jgi:carbonic anhydrase